MRGIHQKGMRGKSNVITKLKQKYKVKGLGCALSIEKYDISIVMGDKKNINTH